MKKSILTFVFAGILAIGAIAQGAAGDKGPKAAKSKKTVEERAQMSVDMLSKRVELAADQKTKVYDLALNRAKTVDGIREKYKGTKDKEAIKKEVNEARQNYRKSVRALLTPEQIEKIKADRKAKKGGKPMANPEKDSDGDVDLGENVD